MTMISKSCRQGLRSLNLIESLDLEKKVDDMVKIDKEKVEKALSSMADMGIVNENTGTNSLNSLKGGPPD